MLRVASQKRALRISPFCRSSFETIRLRPAALYTLSPLIASFAVHRFFSVSRQVEFATESVPSLLEMASLNYPKAPCAPPVWSLSASDIPGIIKSSTESTKELLDKIAALPKTERTYESVVRPMALREGLMDKECEPALFLQYVSIDKATREASTEGDKSLQEFGLSNIARVDIYNALLDAKKHTEENAVKLNKEEQRLLDRMILERTRNGLGLSDEKREKLLEVKKHIMTLAVDFQKNCNEENGSLSFTKEELRGVPESSLSGYPLTDDGKYKVTFKTPDIVPLFRYASLAETRKRAILGYEGKTLMNAPILEEIVRLRRQAAAILGYNNWAEWVLEVKMAKSPSTVMSFLDDLEQKLRPLGEAEKIKLLELKKEECEAEGIKYDGQLNLWDYRYYDRMWIEKNLALDEEKVKEYFPVSTIVPAILDIYKTLLNVRFYPVPKTAEAGGFTWHEEAEMYAVWDGGKDGSSESFLGYMHLDLFPRENKYGHAAVWGLIPGWENADGTRNYPVVSMVANLAKPTPTTPALMKHGDAVTFFHEMGHAFHGLCSKTQFARFHGTAVARDFVEAPSQMLENWCWTPNQLKAMSSHYLRKGEQLPDEIIKSIVKSKTANQGLFNLRQLFHGKYDMMVHTAKEDQDLTKLWCDLREKTSLVTTQGEYVGGQSGFAHIVGGYEAGYYGYLYSQSFSADMFKSIFESNPMDPAKGQLYRDKILQPGGSRDEMESLMDFLGREPTNKAFLESLLGEGPELTAVNA